MLKWTQKTFQASTFSEENIFPPLSQAKKPAGFRTTIDDYAGLFIDYGRRETSYPYSQQNAYTEEAARQLPVVLLENDYLRAEFLPTLGGRLWRLYDKHSQRDLLYTNDVIRFRNLSIRNAWFSGGVEWNCALIGHSPFTCAPLYCAFVHGKGGEEVLRFYEFERVRGIFYQIDFWLEDCKLLVAVRIENPNEKVVPMYWWSNMAVPEYPHGRVIVPASSAYNNSDGIGVKKSSIRWMSTQMSLIRKTFSTPWIIFMISRKIRINLLQVSTLTEQGCCSFPRHDCKGANFFPGDTDPALCIGNGC